MAVNTMAAERTNTARQTAPRRFGGQRVIQIALMTGTLAAVAGLALIARHWELAPSIGILALRYRNLDLDGNHARDKILQHIQECPGLGQSELSAVVEVAPSTVAYHLRVLLDAGRIRRVDSQGWAKPIYFASTTNLASPHVVALAAARQGPRRKQIMDAIKMYPGATRDELGSLIQLHWKNIIPASSLHDHLTQLVAAGAVERCGLRPYTFQPSQVWMDAQDDQSSSIEPLESSAYTTHPEIAGVA